jgi:serine/threonine-protein kinase RsbW
VKQTRSFPAERRSVAAARHFATSALLDTTTEVLEAVELMVSELASNCIRHVNASFELTVTREPEEVRVEVVDRGGGRPAMRAPEPHEASGRGLRIVDMLSARWGVRFDPDSAKTVWFTLTLPRVTEPVR